MNLELVGLYESTHDGDEWGNVMSWFFAVAHVLHHAGEAVPASWNYRHYLYCDGLDTNQYEEAELFHALANGIVTHDDLFEFGDFLDREDERLKANNEAY